MYVTAPAAATALQCHPLQVILKTTEDRIVSPQSLCPCWFKNIGIISKRTLCPGQKKNERTKEKQDTEVFTFPARLSKKHVPCRFWIFFRWSEALTMMLKNLLALPLLFLFSSFSFICWKNFAVGNCVGTGSFVEYISHGFQWFYTVTSVTICVLQQWQ